MKKFLLSIMVLFYSIQMVRTSHKITRMAPQSYIGTGGTDQVVRLKILQYIQQMGTGETYTTPGFYEVSKNTPSYGDATTKRISNNKIMIATGLMLYTGIFKTDEFTQEITQIIEQAIEEGKKKELVENFKKTFPVFSDTLEREATILSVSLEYLYRLSVKQASRTGKPKPKRLIEDSVFLEDIFEDKLIWDERVSMMFIPIQNICRYRRAEIGALKDFLKISKAFAEIRKEGNIQNINKNKAKEWAVFIKRALLGIREVSINLCKIADIVDESFISSNVLNKKKIYDGYVLINSELDEDYLSYSNLSYKRAIELFELYEGNLDRYSLYFEGIFNIIHYNPERYYNTYQFLCRVYEEFIELLRASIHVYNHIATELGQNLVRQDQERYYFKYLRRKKDCRSNLFIIGEDERIKRDRLNANSISRK